MSLISFSNIQDGTAIDAADVNGPLNTLFNDYNGGIDSNNLAASAVIASKLSLASSVTTLANAGTAGGTMYYINLGGLKVCWGGTDSQDAGAGYYGVTLPSGFFSTVQTVVLGNGVPLSGTSKDVLLRTSAASAFTYWLTGSGTGKAQFIVIGT